MIAIRFYNREVFQALNAVLTRFANERGHNNQIATNIILIQCAITQIVSGANMLHVLSGKGGDLNLGLIEKLIVELIDEHNLPMSGFDSSEPVG